MKKITRNAEKFDVIDLFAAMAAEHGYKLDDPISQNAFIDRVRCSFESSKNNEIAIYGKRVEALFAYVAGALGRTTLLKQEDIGALYHIENELLLPDYKLILEDGNCYFVEVKNFYNKDPSAKLVIKEDYYKKLQKYSSICNIDLLFAIYFSSWNKWVLVPIEAFDRKDDSFEIDFATAMAKSEMSILGDCMVGTSPDLELVLLADENEANEIDDDGQAVFTAREIKIYCGGNEVLDSKEKEIAFYFMRFGDWVEKEVEAIVEHDKLLGMRFIYTPDSKTEENFSLIGNLSSMISNMFKEHTVQDGKVVAVNSPLDPESFKVFISKDYKGKQLPLWRFVMQPNYEFTGLTKRSNC